ncbi:MAG: ArnT family glycosyltransferase [Chitinophagaceae bacterium]
MLAGSYSILRNDNRIEYILGLFCLLIYAGTLFFPLLDKDAAHHANIALNMYQTGDYISLVDRGKDYLDKPHLLFWTTLASFKIFGINTFAHRLPAMLFALLSVYSTYKLTRHLTDRTTARIAAIMLATAQAFVLSISDARMETPLTAGIIFGLWQLILYTGKKKIFNLLLGTFGVALAFSTKGWLGPVIIFISIFFHLLLNRKWRVFAMPKTWLFVPLFFIFISPILYAYYLQFDLHPEKLIRGRNNISGIQFILWGQLFERYKGFDEGGRYSDPLFLYHTFLWAFFPWCIAAYMAILFWFRRMLWLRKWRHPVNFAILAFVFILVALSFSKFKMPHYIIMLFPLATIFTAPYLRHVLSFRKAIRIFFPLQIVFAFIVVLLAAALNYYFFKPVNWLLLMTGPVLLMGLIWLLATKTLKKGIKVIYISAGVSILFNLLLNYNFFPQLLKYQAGNEMAKEMKKKNIIIPDDQIMLIEPSAHSFDFYRGYNHAIAPPVEEFEINFEKIKDKYFLINRDNRNKLSAQGFWIEPVISQKDYNVAKVSLKFLNSASREKRMDTLMLVKIYKE